MMRLSWHGARIPQISSESTTLTSLHLWKPLWEPKSQTLMKLWSSISQILTSSSLRTRSNKTQTLKSMMSKQQKAYLAMAQPQEVSSYLGSSSYKCVYRSSWYHLQFKEKHCSSAFDQRLDILSPIRHDWTQNLEEIEMASIAEESLFPPFSLCSTYNICI